MSAFDRVYAALKWLMPKGLPAWEDDGSQILRELLVIADPVSTGAEIIEGLLDQFFPDTTTLLLSRWERVLRQRPRPADTIDQRRARVLAILAKQLGYTDAKLAIALAPLFVLGPADVRFVEVLRAQLDAALTCERDFPLGFLLPNGAVQTEIAIGAAWPGRVDDLGVAVELHFDGATEFRMRLYHPAGFTWNGPLLTADHFSGAERAVFKDLPASGPWRLTLENDGETSVRCTSAKLFVSNDVDAQQIYHFYAQRDPELAGTPDLVAAQRLYNRTDAAHLRALVCERQTFIVGDPHSLCGRDPVGG